MQQRGIYRLQYINNTWVVAIDGHRITFPNLKLATQYLEYLKLWAEEGYLAYYDQEKGLSWMETPNVRSQTPLKKRIRITHKMRRVDPFLQRLRTSTYENTTNHNRH